MPTTAARVRLAGWKSAAGRERYVTQYRTAQKLFDVPLEDQLLPTRFGTTHALVSGPSDGVPVLLLHAAFNTGAIQWYPNVGPLSRIRRVVALDFVGAPGLGEQTVPILNRADCASWLADVADALGAGRVDLVGSSQGGWLALNMAVANPDRVARLALLAPAASLQPFRRAALISIRLGPYMPGWTAGPSLRPIFGKRHRVDDRIVRLLAISLDHYRFQERPVFPDAFSDDELRSVRAQTLVLVGDKEIIYDPRAALSRADSLIPTVETVLVSDAGHLLNIEQPDFVNERLLALLASQPRTAMTPTDGDS